MMKHDKKKEILEVELKNNDTLKAHLKGGIFFVWLDLVAQVFILPCFLVWFKWWPSCFWLMKWWFLGSLCKKGILCCLLSWSDRKWWRASWKRKVREFVFGGDAGSDSELGSLMYTWWLFPSEQKKNLVLVSYLVLPLSFPFWSGYIASFVIWSCHF